MNLFQRLWQNWVRFPHGKPTDEEMSWLNELNQAVFAQLEKRLPEDIQVRVATAPVQQYCTRDENGEVYHHVATVSTERITIPEGPFEKRVELAVELLLELIEKPGTRTAFLYWPIYPLGNELVGGDPNRKYLCTRLARTPNVAVDASERNT